MAAGAFAGRGVGAMMVVFLLEEASMKAVFDILLSRILK